MISNLHYYNSYKPFILDKEKNKELKVSPYRYINQSKNYKNNQFTYFLNKALNDDVKSYMFELSSNFNGVKNIANKIYEKIYYNFSDDNLEEQFENFTFSYNRLIGFLEENAENSSGFSKILKNVTNTIENNISILNNIGINMSENGFLSLENYQNEKSATDVEKLKEFYNNFYDKMCSFMSEPMSNHMDFKDFSYYFNYGGDYDKNNSFKLIEQGLLVDISL